MATQTDPERIASLETAIQYLAGGQARMDARLDRIVAVQHKCQGKWSA